MIRSRLRQIRIGDGRSDDGIGSAVTLEQSLMRRREEREARQEVFVVRFDACGKSGARIARNNKADQDGIHIDLMLIGRAPAAEAASIGKLRVNGGIERNDVASGTVGDRNRAPEV